MTDQFFADVYPQRDKSGKPLLLPRGSDVREPYFRASQLLHALEDDYHIQKWQQRGLAKGLSQLPQVIRMIAAESYTSGFATDPRANSEAGRRIDDHIEYALRVGGTSEKADYGTAVHALTEPGSTGTGDESIVQEANALRQLWADAGVKPLAHELFTACDEIRTAGTFDHLAFVPGYGVVITDTKTSRQASGQYNVQLSVYAHGDIYDPYTDERMSLPDYVSLQGYDPSLFNPNVGIVWWVKNGKCEARLLDLTQGWKFARIAYDVLTEFRKIGVAKNVTKDLLREAERLELGYEPELIEPTVEPELDEFWR